MTDEIKMITPTEARMVLKKMGILATARSIRKWCDAGKIQGAVKVVGRWNIPSGSIEKLVTG